MTVSVCFLGCNEAVASLSAARGALRKRFAGVPEVESAETKQMKRLKVWVTSGYSRKPVKLLPSATVLMFPGVRLQILRPHFHGIAAYF